MLTNTQQRKSRFQSRRTLAAILMLSTPVLFSPVAVQAQTGDYDIGGKETSDQGPRYEDDAWYDVSEWFDGNDYNPTDEAIGRWDDEVFSYHDALTSDDSDNDRNVIDFETFYGEAPNSDAIRYTDADNDGQYERMEKYVDTNGDYLADSYVTYDDADGDGIYDKYDYSELGNRTNRDVHPKNVAQTVAQGLSGKRYQASGKITERTNVDRMGDISLLLKVEAENGSSVWVDMGPESSFQMFPGDPITVQGPVVKRGNKSVLLATVLVYEGKDYPITRPGRKYTGTVDSIKTATVQGNKHMVVKLKTKAGKMLTVDMGLEANAKKLEKGDTLSVTGVPASVGDRVILIADKTQS